MTSPRTLLTAWNLKAKKALGQNFLRDPADGARIVRAARIGPGDRVLEIGAGLGALTLPLARSAGSVLAVEIDPEVASLLRTELVAAGLNHVEVLREDILKLDLSRAAAEGPLVVMGNLPYHISSQVLVRLVEHRRGVDRAVLMFQREMARRIAAGPGSRDYGRLSVLTQYAARVRKLLDLEASRFFPRPKVDSEVLEIRFLPAPEHPAADEAFLFRVVRAAFGLRRKTLKNALAGSDLSLDPGTAERALLGAGIDPGRRAETLSVAEFVRLSDVLGRPGP